MHGAGTRTDIMIGKPAGRILDLSRLTSRAGKQLTGVDRVELAYLQQFLAMDVPAYGLVRTTLGFILLGRDGLGLLKASIESNTTQAELLSALRGAAVARCRPYLLGIMLRRHVPQGSHYINVGHSSFSSRLVRGLKFAGVGKIAVMVHDTIPLDFPNLQRDGSVARFAKFLNRVANTADVVLCSSAQTAVDFRRHAPRATGHVVVAHLGVSVPVAGQRPSGAWVSPYFVALGTIEPRKNHQFLLDIWADICDQPDAPHLVICGGRGWKNSEVFARLDTRPANVHERADLSDSEVAALMNGSAGLLFPSLSEGFGFPPYEAAALGVPVLCNDLAVLKEGLGNIPIYAKVTDRYLWVRKINEMATAFRANDGARAVDPSLNLPTWTAHFNIVLSLI